MSSRHTFALCSAFMLAVSGAAAAAPESIVTGGGPLITNSTWIRTFESNGAPRDAGFYAYPWTMMGALVAAGDVDGDGVDEIITGAGPQRTS